MTPNGRKIAMALLRTAFIAAATLGCIWDRDTLQDELQDGPDDFTLIVGRWHRHTDEFYEHRIREVETRLTSEPRNFGLYDDLAVAYERLGRTEEAIRVIESKEIAMVDGATVDERYRSLANYGTFLAHSGRFDAAVRRLEAAVELNPEAHFGRERLQIDLIRYLGAAEQDEVIWSTGSFLRWSGYRLSPTRALLPRDRDQFRGQESRDAARDISFRDLHEGTAGMLRFGGIEGAELYRALGDIHLAEEDLNLAWWAYKRAIERGHPAQTRLQEIVAHIESHWSDASAPGVPTEEVYRRVRAHADLWLECFQSLERTALARGDDPGDPDVLAQLIREANIAAGEPPRAGPPRWQVFVRGFEFRVAAFLSLFFVVPAAAAVAYFRFDRRRLRRTEAAPKEPG